MRTHNSYEYGRREFQLRHEDDGALTASLLLLGALAGSLYLLAAVLHFRALQLAEVVFYLAAIGALLAVCVWYWRGGRSRIADTWPHAPLFIPMLRDQANLRAAWKEDAIVAGYDSCGRPWLFPDQRRRMQTLLLGQSGSGKSTLLLNIAAQDLHRKVGGKPVPLIILDGKGDQQFLHAFLDEVYAAGRCADLRILDPFAPKISARFNPLFGPAHSRTERATAFFDSFVLRHDFFRAHQATYLSDLCRVLDYAEAIYTIPDLVVMARDATVMKEEIAKARRKVEEDATVSPERRRNFAMSAQNLLQSLADRERIPKIQGLLNELMTFAEDELSQITNASEDLLTFEEVVERSLILFVSLNTNKNSKAVTALGRMLLKNLQLIVGERYRAAANQNGKCDRPISVILDEFAPFAHENFSHLLQTARGSNVGFIFSLQSIPQLRGVSRNFADEVSSAANTVMLLRTRDEESARFFLDASARITAARRTMTIERKGLVAPGYREIGFGSVTETERTRAVDFELKNLPVGQMQVLTTDDRLGTLHLHLHVRRPRSLHLESFAPVLYERTRSSISAGGANLRFRDAEPSRPMGRRFSASLRGRL